MNLWQNRDDLCRRNKRHLLWSLFHSLNFHDLCIFSLMNLLFVNMHEVHIYVILLLLLKIFFSSVWFFFSHFFLLLRFHSTFENKGARRYLMKEPDSSIPACRRRIYLILIFDRLFRVLLFGYIFYLLGKKINLFSTDIPYLEVGNDTIIERF